MGAEPFFFNHSDKENATQTYATILKYFTIVGAIGLMIVVFYIDLLRPIFIKQESYLLALDIVPIVLLANLCLGIYHNLSIWYKLTDRTHFGMYISLISAAITIAFNLIFIPKIGFMACAYATLIAYGLMMLISYVLGRKYYPVPYDISRISIYLLLSAGLSFITYYHFDRNMLLGTVFLLCFVVLIGFLERKELKQELPIGTEAQVRPRSGLAAKKGITVLNAPGTIDADYRGEIGVILVNLSNEDFTINNGERIAQLVIAKHERAEWELTEELSSTVRGEGGFGSTGVK